MRPLTYAGNLQTNFINHWTRVTEVGKPTIAAVSGYAVRVLGMGRGGGVAAALDDAFLSRATARHRRRT